MSAAPVRTRRYTLAEYLALDAEAPEGVRYEWWDGEVWPVHGYDADGVMMAGAEPEHNELVTNAVVELRQRLRPQGCKVFSSDQRVAIGTRYVYPDVVVSCTPQYDDSRPRRLLTPDLVVEVASASTAAADRGPKLVRYTEVPGLREIWIAEVDRVLLTQYVREGESWRLLAYTSLDAVLTSPAFGVEVPLAALYDGVLPSE